MVLDHVFLAAGFALLHFDERDIEVVGRVHVVRAVLVPQRPHPLRARPQRQVVQFELITLMPFCFTRKKKVGCDDGRAVVNRGQCTKIDRPSSYLSMWSSISCRTSRRLENCSRLSEGFIVCGRSDGMTRVAIKLTERPFFLLLIMRWYMPNLEARASRI